MGLVLTLNEGEGFTITTPEGDKIAVEFTITKWGYRLNVTAPQEYRISRDTKKTRATVFQDPNPTNDPSLKVRPGDCPKCGCKTVKVMRSSAQAQCQQCWAKWEIEVPRV